MGVVKVVVDVIEGADAVGVVEMSMLVIGACVIEDVIEAVVAVGAVKMGILVVCA